MKALIAPAINLVGLIAIMVYALKDKIPVFVQDRKRQLEKELVDAQSKLEEAKKNQQELAAKVRAFDADVGQMKEEFTQQAQKHRAAILSHAQSLVVQIKEDAQSSAKSITQDFKREITMEFVDQVLSKAEKILKERVDSGAKNKLNKEFSHQLAGVSA